MRRRACCPHGVLGEGHVALMIGPWRPRRVLVSLTARIERNGALGGSGCEAVGRGTDHPHGTARHDRSSPLLKVLSSIVVPTAVRWATSAARDSLKVACLLSMLHCVRSDLVLYLCPCCKGCSRFLTYLGFTRKDSGVAGASGCDSAATVVSVKDSSPGPQKLVVAWVRFSRQVLHRTLPARLVQYRTWRKRAQHPVLLSTPAVRPRVSHTSSNQG